MTEQDGGTQSGDSTADGESPSPDAEAADGDDAPEADGSTTADQSATDEEASAEDSGTPDEDVDLGDIAEEPVGDVDEALAEIATDTDPEEELVEHVTETDAETVAWELATLREEVERLRAELDERENEVDDLESRLARKQADFQNYKKRQKERLEEEKERATEDLVGRLLEVRDSLERALDQEDDGDIRGGVESTVRQFDEQLRRENVEPIEPEPGDETDPRRHEVLMSVESDRPEGTVVDVHRPGYEMAGKVLREAQVTVSDGESE